MFPIPFNFPYRKNNGALTTISNIVDEIDGKIDSVSADLGNKSSASSVTGDDAFSKINTLNSELVSQFNVYGAKNLIPFPYHRVSGYSSNGATSTYDDEGVITVNKVAGSATAFFAIFSSILYPNAKLFLAPNTRYILSMELENAIDTSCHLQVVNGTDLTAIRNKGTGKYEVTFTTPENVDFIHLALYWSNSTVETNAKVKIMIRLATIQDDTYRPYAMTNKELTSSLKWNYDGSVVGTAQKSLPQNWKELKIRVVLPYTDFDINVTFSLIREELYSTPIFIDEGANGIDVRLYIGHDSCVLNTAYVDYGTRYDFINTATIYFWYR